MQGDPEKIQGNLKEMERDLGSEIYARYCETGRRHREIREDAGDRFRGRY
jgi:hypothetical protein